MRHGHAEPEAPCDRLRELSLVGEQEVRRAVVDNAGSLTGVGRLLVSPYARAQQTANIVKSLLDGVADLTSDLLIPSGCPNNVVDCVSDLIADDSESSIMLIGHQPLLGVLLDQLCGLEPGRHRLATASLAALDFEVLADNCCDLRWVRHVS